MDKDSTVYQRVEKLSEGYSISIESTLQMGFNQLRKAPGIFIIYSFIAIIALSNPLTGIVLGGSILVGYYLFIRHLRTGKDLDIGIFFHGFYKFVPLLILNLLMAIMIAIGFFLFIIPGIYLTISYLFTHLFVCFYNIPPADALTLSRKMVKGNFIQILYLCLILLGINILGVLALGVGVLLTIPFSACVIYAAFDDIIGIT